MTNISNTNEQSGNSKSTNKIYLIFTSIAVVTIAIVVVYFIVFNKSNYEKGLLHINNNLELRRMDKLTELNDAVEDFNKVNQNDSVDYKKANECMNYINAKKLYVNHQYSDAYNLIKDMKYLKESSKDVYIKLGKKDYNKEEIISFLQSDEPIFIEYKILTDPMISSLSLNNQRKDRENVDKTVEDFGEIGKQLKELEKITK